MTGYIYKFTNKINGKVYIGQTYNLQTRLNSHKSKALKIKTKFYNAITKQVGNSPTFKASYFGYKIFEKPIILADLDKEW